MKPSQQMVSEDIFKNRSQKILSQHDLNKWSQTKIPKIFKRRPQQMVSRNGLGQWCQKKVSHSMSKSSFKKWSPPNGIRK